MEASPGVPDADRATPRLAKEQIIAELRRDYTALKRQWGGYSGYDAWFAGPLNNAQLNTVATYYDWVPVFQRLLRENGSDLERFYQAVDRLARLSKKERHRQMADLLRAGGATAGVAPMLP